MTSSEKPMTPERTWCYTTIFACHENQLHLAKSRYRDRIEKVQEKFEVVFASEQASILGQPEPIFELLTSEINGTGLPMPEEEAVDYAIFFFSTIVLIPQTDHGEGHMMREVAATLELDEANEYPGVVPSRTSSAIVVPPSQLTGSCTFT